jgi:hypothetical protein
MRPLKPIQLLFATVALSVVLAGCSGASAIALRPTVLQRADSPRVGYAVAAFHPLEQQTRRHRVSFDSCPAKGPIKYVSDLNNGLVYIYVGKFSGQAPCGQIAPQFYEPTGLYVDRRTHDLYVGTGNFLNLNSVLVFHRGQTIPYNQYKNAHHELIMGVTVAKDGTVIASNELGDQGASISTWIGGPNGGSYVGSFPMEYGSQGGFITAQRNGTIYFDDFEITNTGALWSVSCPAGACGIQTKVAGVSISRPGGLKFDASGDLLAVSSDFTGHTSMALTFELPNPSPSTFPMNGSPFGMAINPLDDHMYVADIKGDFAAEYSYPSGALVGTVPAGVSGGTLIDVAIDP